MLIDLNSIVMNKRKEKKRKKKEEINKLKNFPIEGISRVNIY